MNLIFAFGEGIIIFSAVILGRFARLGAEAISFNDIEMLPWKVMVIVSVMQITFYYFDLYETRNFRQRMRMGMALIKALGVSAVALSVLYYLAPSLAMGRGIVVFSLVIIFLFALIWRLLYSWLVINIIGFKERVLIIGTGEKAKRTAREIHEDGQDNFEIVGFVDE